MKTYSAVIEKCHETNMFVGYVPGFSGAHSQGETLEELRENLIEVIEMLEDKEDYDSAVKVKMTNEK
jgi:predicted RNase H-like HicB family nuclease